MKEKLVLFVKVIKIVFIPPFILSLIIFFLFFSEISLFYDSIPIILQYFVFCALSLLIKDKWVRIIMQLGYGLYSSVGPGTFVILSRIQWDASSWDPHYIIPIIGVEELIYRLLFMIIWPIVGSILIVLVVPRIFAPLYLRYKKIRHRKFIDMYADIDLTQQPSLRTLINRTAFVFLLCLTLITTLFKSNIILPQNVIKAHFGESHYSYVELENIALLSGAPLLIMPIVIGILSVGWVIEDVGLMHYSIKNNKYNSYYVIEPIHHRYIRIIKGYVSIFTIFILFTNIGYDIFRYSEPDFEVYSIFYQIMKWILIFFTFIGSMYPAYIIYCRLSKNFLREGLKKKTEHIKIAFIKKP